MTTNPRPKAKAERLIVRELDGETLVYDRSRAAASCLNELATRVWRKSDGETSIAAIAAALGEDEGAVWLALHHQRPAGRRETRESPTALTEGTRRTKPRLAAPTRSAGMRSPGSRWRTSLPR